MIPILYDTNETIFISNGLGRLSDCIRCECYEERNGIYEVEFDYPVNGAHYNEIVCGRIIAVTHDESKDIQPFDIYKASKPINGVVTFNACHISYRQNRMVVANGGPINDINDAFTLLAAAQPDNPFTYETNIASTAYMSGAEGSPKTVRQLLGGVEGSILDAYGGEYEWDKWTVKLWESRGTVTSYTIRYGLNMVDYQDETDYSDTYNAAVPYWIGQDDNGIDSTVVGDMVTSGASMYTNRTACVPLDLTDKFESKPTKANLEAMALSYMSSNQTSLPAQNIKVDFMRLQDTSEYKALQNCKLCDQVRVVFPQYNMDGYFKIVKTTYDVLLERYTEMELGTLSTTLAKALGIDNSASASANNLLVEKGTDGIWTYRKWADGTSECWGRSGLNTVAINSAYGGAYYGSSMSADPFPSGLFLNSAPMITSELLGGDGCWAGIGTATTTQFTYYPFCVKSGNHSFVLSAHCIGKWK